MGQLRSGFRLDAPVVSNGVGEWVLTLARNHEHADALLAPGAGIVVTDLDTGYVLFSGPVDMPERSQQAGDPGVELTVRGVTDDVVLEDALAYPDPTNSDADSQDVAFDERTGPAESLMHEFVHANIGGAATAERRRPGLEVAGSQGLGDETTVAGQFQTLLELCQTLGTAHGIGFRVVQVGSGLVFHTWAHADLSGAVRLSVDGRSLTSARTGFGVPAVTRVVVAGNGGALDRFYIDKSSESAAAAEALWGRRRERFVDQRSTRNIDELESAADEVLNETPFPNFFGEVVPAEDSPFVFGRDWVLGDVVTVTVDGVEFGAPMQGFVVRLDSDGERVGFTLGDPSASAATYGLAQVASATRRLAQQVGNLSRDDLRPEVGFARDAAVAADGKADDALSSAQDALDDAAAAIVAAGEAESAAVSAGQTAQDAMDEAGAAIVAAGEAESAALIAQAKADAAEQAAVDVEASAKAYADSVAASEAAAAKADAVSEAAADAATKAQLAQQAAEAAAKDYADVVAGDAEAGAVAAAAADAQAKADAAEQAAVTAAEADAAAKAAAAEAAAVAQAASDASAEYGRAKLLTEEWGYPTGTEINGAYIRTGTVAANKVVVGGASPLEGLLDSMWAATVEAHERWAPVGQTTIDGGKITADSIDALQISANAITSKHTLTGPLIQTTATAARGVKLSSAGLVGYSPSGSSVFTLTTDGQLTVAGGVLTDGTITGGTVQTSASANTGVKITDGGIVGYGSGSPKFTLSATTGEVSMIGNINSGSAITGAMFRTATSGERLEINTDSLKKSRVTFHSALSGPVPNYQPAEIRADSDYMNADSWYDDVTLRGAFISTEDPWSRPEIALTTMKTDGLGIKTTATVFGDRISLVSTQDAKLQLEEDSIRLTIPGIFGDPGMWVSGDDVTVFSDDQLNLDSWGDVNVTSLDGNIIMTAGAAFGLRTNGQSTNSLFVSTNGDITTSGRVDVGSHFTVALNSRMDGYLIVNGNLDVPNMVSGGSANVNYNSNNGRLRVVSSSRKFKTNFSPLVSDVDSILELEPTRYDRIDDEDPSILTPEVGFIAEDAQDLGLDDYLVFDTEGELFSFDYYKFSAVAHHAVLREQRDRIASLEARLAALEAA